MTKNGLLAGLGDCQALAVRSAAVADAEDAQGVVLKGEQDAVVAEAEKEPVMSP
ncbi:MAG TPA: hypothetical protein VGK64_17045 [Bryobacteraceae bacterium]